MTAPKGRGIHPRTAVGTLTALRHEQAKSPAFTQNAGEGVIFYIIYPPTALVEIIGIIESVWYFSWEIFRYHRCLRRQEISGGPRAWRAPDALAQSFNTMDTHGGLHILAKASIAPDALGESYVSSPRESKYILRPSTRLDVSAVSSIISRCFDCLDQIYSQWYQDLFARTGIIICIKSSSRDRKQTLLLTIHINIESFQY